MSAASRAIGVSIGTIASALERGTLENVGNGKSKPQPYEHDRVTYKSRAECARAFNIHPATFNSRIERGLDPVTGEKTHLKDGWSIQPKPMLMPCGTLYPSIKSAARAYGVTPQAIRCAIRRGTLHNVGTVKGLRPVRDND
jgi:hypothetical protein